MENLSTQLARPVRRADSAARAGFRCGAAGYPTSMEHEERNDDELERGMPPAPEAPPDTSEHPSHEEEVGGAGAEDPDEMADEDRYRKGPGW